MPTGIPVATVAINGGANAGILAAKILATSGNQNGFHLVHIVQIKRTKI